MLSLHQKVDGATQLRAVTSKQGPKGDGRARKYLKDAAKGQKNEVVPPIPRIFYTSEEGEGVTKVRRFGAFEWSTDKGYKII